MNVPSPCINVCKMNPARSHCEGCFRSIPEITEWSRASDERRLAILAEVARRRAASGLSGACADPA